jgi:hypothetical protein
MRRHFPLGMSNTQPFADQGIRNGRPLPAFAIRARSMLMIRPPAARSRDRPARRPSSRIAGSARASCAPPRQESRAPNGIASRSPRFAAMVAPCGRFAPISAAPGRTVPAPVGGIRSEDVFETAGCRSSQCGTNQSPASRYHRSCWTLAAGDCRCPVRMDGTGCFCRFGMIGVDRGIS